MINISSEDLKLIRKFENIRQRGYYCNGNEVTNIYNRVLNKNVASTNCSSCIRQRIQELVNAANAFEKMLAKESENEEQVNNMPQEENKAIVDEIPEQNKPSKGRRKKTK